MKSAPQPQAEQAPGNQAAEYGGQAHREVVHGKRRIAIAERLQGADLLALSGDEPGEHEVHEKGGDGEEEIADQVAGDAVLHQFIAQEGVGDLVFAAVAAGAAVGCEEVIDRCDRPRLRRAGGEGNRQIVERTFQIERGCQCIAMHPDDTESLIVGEDLSWPDLVDELGREPDADDAQPLPAPIDDRGHAVAGHEAMRGREHLGDHRLVGTPRFGKSPLFKVDAIDAAGGVGWQRQKLSGDRLREARHVEDHERGDARFHRRHPGEFRHIPRNRVGRAAQPNEDIGEAPAVVVLVAGAQQRVVVAAQRDHRRDAASHHGADRHHLTGEAAEVAQQLP